MEIILILLRYLKIDFKFAFLVTKSNAFPALFLDSYNTFILITLLCQRKTITLTSGFYVLLKHSEIGNVYLLILIMILLSVIQLSG